AKRPTELALAEKRVDEIGDAADGAACSAEHTQPKQATHDRREAPMKRLLILTAAVGGLAFALTASAAPMNATLTIRHQLRGCHSWSLNGGAFQPSQTVRLAGGGSIAVADQPVIYPPAVEGARPARPFAPRS